MMEDYMTLFPAHTRDLPRFSALARAILAQAEDLISVIPALASGFSADGAVGTQLDVLGASFGCPRSDAADTSDETFRAYLKAKLALWRWDGTNLTVPALLQKAFPGQSVSVVDNGDMTLTGVNTESLPGEAGELLPVPAGVRLE